MNLSAISHKIKIPEITSLSNSSNSAEQNYNQSKSIYERVLMKIAKEDVPTKRKNKKIII
jgi:hypothetical protein